MLEHQQVPESSALVCVCVLLTVIVEYVPFIYFVYFIYLVFIYLLGSAVA